jgi:glutamate dehydrogenase
MVSLALFERPQAEPITGDLGSNEILLSKDKTIAIIDGSGTIYDPVGLDRSELERLARARKMISEFDASKLSKEGYRVLVDDVDKTLPGDLTALPFEL